jgi:hypothetical protein
VPGRDPCPRGRLFDEAAEAEVAVNIVGQRGPARRQGRPYRVKLEASVAGRVQAVMEKEVNLPQPAYQFRQPAPARPL